MEGRPDNISDEEWLHGKWFLLHKRIDGIDAANLDLSGMKVIEAPAGQFYADPFVMKQGEAHEVYFELFDYKKGQFAKLTIDGDTVTDPVPVDIGVASHLSFPYVFETDGELYMVPESCHLNQINLYHHAGGVWSLDKTLIPYVHSGDNQLLFHDGMWWMFCMVYDNARNRNVLAIYYSATIHGEWGEHELVNPEADMRNDHVSRGAGRIFTDTEGRLIRPAQYSNRGVNGEGVILYEIKNLTTTGYSEEVVTVIRPDDVGARASHTFSVSDGILLMDARQERETDPPFVSISDDDISAIDKLNIYE